MIRLGTLLVAGLSLAAGVGSFLATRSLGHDESARRADTGPQWNEPLARLLDLSAEQIQSIHEHDPRFREDAETLDAALRKEREQLATLLEEPSTSDEQLLGQVERVIAAHDALERRVARYFVAVRHHLTADQQKQLLGQAASSVREAARYRSRHGQGSGRGEGWRRVGHSGR